MKKVNRTILGLGIVGVFILLGWMVYFLFRPSFFPPSSLSEKLRPAPLFELRDSRDQVHSLKDLVGNIVLVHFWASWCAPCIDEIPELVQFSKGVAAQKKKVKVVLITLDSKWEEAHRILPSQGLPESLISLMDSSLKTPESFGTYGYPETYLLDDSLRIVTKWIGPQPWKDPFFLNVIDQIYPEKD